MDKALQRDACELTPHARRAWIGYTRHMAGALKKLGLHLSQYAMLALLDQRGKMTMSVVGRELGVTMGAGTNLTDRLVDAGLVVRDRDTEDRRVVWVELTNKGRAALKSAEGVAADYLASRLAALDGAERGALIAACRKLATETTPAPAGT
mgnify:CR=1 FL=1